MVGPVRHNVKQLIQATFLTKQSPVDRRLYKDKQAAHVDIFPVGVCLLYTSDAADE